MAEQDVWHVEELLPAYKRAWWVEGDHFHTAAAMAERMSAYQRDDWEVVEDNRRGQDRFVTLGKSTHGKGQPRRIRLYLMRCRGRLCSSCPIASARRKRNEQGRNVGG